MTPKRGQPPKPPEKKRSVEKKVLYSPEEIGILEKAYELSGAERPFGRWHAEISLEEAQRIIAQHES